MTLDQISMYVRSTQALVSRELAALTNVIAMGSRAESDGLKSFVEELETR